MAQSLIVITPADAKTDGDSGFTELAGARGVAIFTVDSTPYAIVASRTDSGVQIINLSDPTNITPADAKTDGDSGFTELGGAHGVATFIVDDILYAIVGSYSDDGVQIINLSDPTNITPADAKTDGDSGFTELGGAHGVATFIVDDILYAIVGSYSDDGVQIIKLGIQTSNLSLSIETPIPIPEWIKKYAEWWSNNQIDNNTFLTGIEFMIQNSLLNVSCSTKFTSYEIPEWIKISAGWWAEGSISEDEFILGIEYLIENKIIKATCI